MTIAIFPGSFDPIHNGHVEVIERAHKLFERVYVAVLQNPSKGNAFFEPGEREDLIREISRPWPNVEVISMSTLAVDAARQVNADVIIRGLRAVSDFEFELQMAQMNQQLSGIETLFVPTGAAFSFIASRLVREIAVYGGDVGHFVPEVVALAMKRHVGG